MANREWVKDAACRGKRAAVFFPDQKIPNDSRYSEALAVCAECPVTQQCLEIVIVLEDTDDRWGVFGGMTPPQRAQLRRELKEVFR